MSDSPAPAPASATLAADLPPEDLIAAAQEAMDKRLASYGFNVAPAALRMVAIDAVKAARTAAQARMLGARHG